MKNITKNLMLGLAGVCAIAIIWFVIELIVINRNAEPRDTGSVVAAGTPDADADTPDEDDDLPGDSDGPDYGSSEEETPRPPPRGQPYALGLDPDNENVVLNVYAQSELFEYIRNDEDWTFEYRGGGNAALKITFVYLTPQGARADAERFLNDVLGEDIADFRGTQRILESELNGVAVQAQQGNITYEAWLYIPPNNDLALAFLINYEFNDQRDALYEVINSMSISDDPLPQDGGGDTGTVADADTGADADTNTTDEGTEGNDGNGTEG